MCGRYLWSLSLVVGIVLLSDVVAADFSGHNSSDVDSRDQRVRMLSSSALTCYNSRAPFSEILRNINYQFTIYITKNVL